MGSAGASFADHAKLAHLADLATELPGRSAARSFARSAASGAGHSANPAAIRSSDPAIVAPAAASAITAGAADDAACSSDVWDSTSHLSQLHHNGPSHCDHHSSGLSCGAPKVEECHGKFPHDIQNISVNIPLNKASWQLPVGK